MLRFNLFLLLLSFLGSLSMYSQNKEQQLVLDSVSQKKPVPLSYITPNSITTITTLKDQRAKLNEKTDLSKVNQLWDSLELDINNYLTFFEQVKYKESRMIVLYNHQKELAFWRDQVQKMILTNVEKNEDFEEQFQKLVSQKKQWEITLDTYAELDVERVVITQVKTVIHEIEINQKMIRKAQTLYITIDGKMTKESLALSRKINQLKKHRSLALENLKDIGDSDHQLNSNFEEFKKTKLDFYKTDIFYLEWVLKTLTWSSFTYFVLIFIVTYLLFDSAERNIKYYPYWAGHVGSQGALRYIFSHKLYLTIVIVLLACHRVIPTLSHYYEAILNLSILLLIRPTCKHLKMIEIPYLWNSLLVLLVLNVALLPYIGVSSFEWVLILCNVILLSIMVFGIVKRVKSRGGTSYKYFNVMYLYPFSVLVGLVTDEFMLLYFPIDLAMSLITFLIQIFFLIRLMVVILPIALLSKKWFFIRSIKKNRVAIVNLFYRLLLYFGIYKVFILPANMLQVSDMLKEGLDAVLDFGLDLESGDLTVKTILVFGLGIYLSLTASKIISTFLKEDVFYRFKVKPDMASASLLLTKIGVFSFGLYFSMLLAGINVSNFAVVLGALSVGIGFGLQSLVANFISGLILMAERPVKLGDVLELSDATLGEIKEIGIRSSKIRKFDGAEMVVPNSDLVANKFTNWTLSDKNRRFTIIVGVSYSTDPKVVREILVHVVRNCDAIMKTPEPAIVMTGFGESSLDFEVKAWVEHSWVETRSQLLIAIYHEFMKEGIEIPFPQRDLHIIDNGSGQDVEGKDGSLGHNYLK